MGSAGCRDRGLGGLVEGSDAWVLTASEQRRLACRSGGSGRGPCGPAGESPRPAQCLPSADSQHGGDQVVQRPGQVLPGDQDNLVIDAKMVNRPSRNRAVGRQGGRAASARARSSSHGPVSPGAPVSTIRRRMVPSGPIRVTTTLISSVCPLRAHFGRQTTTMAARGHARPVTRLADCRKRDHAPSTQSRAPQTSPIAAGNACPR